MRGYKRETEVQVLFFIFSRYKGWAREPMLHHAAMRVEQLLKQHQSSIPSPSPSFFALKPPTSTPPPHPPHSPILPRPASPHQKPAHEQQSASSPKLGPKVGPTLKIGMQQKSEPQTQYMYGIALESAGEDVVNVLVGIVWRDEVDIRRFRRESILFEYFSILFFFLFLSLAFISP